MTQPEVFIFDLDGTIAESKQPITARMAEMLTQLLAHSRVAIASGGKFKQLHKQVANQLPANTQLEKLYFLPTSGAALYYYRDTKWHTVYEKLLTDTEAIHITKAIEQAVKSTRVIFPNTTLYGTQTEFRGTEVSFSALGQNAPLEQKRTWDPTREKREILHASLVPLLSEYEVHIGGMTTIDITQKGIDKAYGIERLSEFLSIPITHMLYIGDELQNGGNDEAVLRTQAHTHKVTDPRDTYRFITELLTHEDI
ncbi:MAG TPA: HAD-IIB family hydrolase [Candidatus Kaiserbacteria bacterium]|nr:HAD-IIB family hydrolase [Candidatus Kaiserbacteria bacterium]